jgi:hypothetical protein
LLQCRHVGYLEAILGLGEETLSLMDRVWELIPDYPPAPVQSDAGAA